MSTLPAAGVLGNASIDVADYQTEIENLRDFIAESTGGAARGALTIASGAIVPPDGSGGGVFTVDTEGAAATDDLTSVTTTNTPDGRIIRLFLANAARIVTLKHGTGNLSLMNNADLEMVFTNQWIDLQRVSSTWIEVDRSDPPCLVSAYLTADQTLSDATETTLTGWTEAYDTLNAFNATTGTFTAPATGLYQSSWQAELAVNAGNATEAFRTMLTDGAGNDRAYGVGWNNTTSTVNLYSVGSTLLPLTRGDVVLFRAIHNTGVSRDVKGGATGARFSINRVW